MPNTIKFSDNPNEETAFVTTEDDTRTRVVLTTPVDGTVKFPDNPNSTKVSVTVDGVARKAVAVYNLGGGGGDQHNLGWYATESALTTAYPTATDGDWAIVGSTDTVWVWDSDTTAWVDTDTKGQVTSVNGQTGAVTLTIPDAIQVDTMPTAGADELGKVYQFIGTTGTYTHGYFYECVSDGQTPATYSWTEVSMGGGSSYTAGTGIDITSGVISVTSPTLTNVATGNGSIMIGATSELGRANSVVIGDGAHNAAFATNTVIIGRSATSSTNAIAIGTSAQNTSVNSIAIGYSAKTTTQYAIQLNCSGSTATNSDTNTFKVANNNGNYEIMDANGNLPADRLAPTTGLADGNYRLRLTMSNGTPTLSWVAE